MGIGIELVVTVDSYGGALERHDGHEQLHRDRTQEDEDSVPAGHAP